MREKIYIYEKELSKANTQKLSVIICSNKTMRLMVSRYNNKTLEEVTYYRNINNIENDKSIYCSPMQIKNDIPINETLMILEMNNDTNKVIGVGLIKNYIWADKQYNIYTERNYSRYIYKGNYRILREEIETIGKKYESLMKIFDLVLFKGKTHVKRGQGITEVPEKLYAHIKINEEGLMDLLRQMFKDRFASPKTSAK